MENRSVWRIDNQRIHETVLHSYIFPEYTTVFKLFINTSYVYDCRTGSLIYAMHLLKTTCVPRIAFGYYISSNTKIPCFSTDLKKNCEFLKMSDNSILS